MSPHKHLLCAFIVSSITLAPALGEIFWEPVSLPGEPALTHHDSAYDSSGNRMVVCGRPDDSGNVETYFFSADRVWSQGPSANTGFTGWFVADPEITFDPLRNCIVLYTATEADVETWELSGGVWSIKSPATRPTPCPDGAHLIYDPNLQASVLVACNGYPDSTQPSKTWLWNGTDWSLLPGISPTGAAGGSMAFDTKRQEMVLVTMGTMQTWSLKNGVWTQKTPAHSIPDGLWVFKMACDQGQGKILAYGGERGQWPDLEYPDETWAWDGTDWTLYETALGPGPNLDFTFEYFPPVQGLFLHGGWAPPDWEMLAVSWILPSPQEITRITDLSIRIDGEYLLLEWTENPQILSYQVYYGPSPHGPFAPATDNPIQRGYLHLPLWELYQPQQYYYVEPVIP